MSNHVIETCFFWRVEVARRLKPLSWSHAWRYHHVSETTTTPQELAERTAFSFQLLPELSRFCWNTFLAKMILKKAVHIALNAAMINKWPAWPGKSHENWSTEQVSAKVSSHAFWTLRKKCPRSVLTIVLAMPFL